MVVPRIFQQKQDNLPLPVIPKIFVQIALLTFQHGYGIIYTTRGKEVKKMTGLEGFVCGVLVVVAIWLVSSDIKARGQEKYIEGLIIRIRNIWRGR